MLIWQILGPCRSTSEVLSDIGGQASLTFGIGNGNVGKFNANVADNDFLRIDGTAIEGRSASEMISDLGIEAGATANTGTVTSIGISPGTGLDAGTAITTNGTISVTLDLSELTDMTADVVGADDELILLDSGAERRKAINEIKLSQFNNDSNFTGATDISGKQDTITSSNRLSATLIGANGTISNTEYGYLNGVTSAIQTQLDAKLPKAGGTMTGDLTVSSGASGDATLIIESDTDNNNENDINTNNNIQL